MTSKQERLQAASEQAGERFTRARKPRPHRQAFISIAAENQTSEELEATPNDIEEVRGVQETEAVAAEVSVLEDTRQNKGSIGTKAESPSAPAWKPLCQPAARKGTAGKQRRYNVPASYELMQMINNIDANQTYAGEQRINRNALVQAAAETYAENQSYWVREWERSGQRPPVTTSIQARVPDATITAINSLRYYDDGTGVRPVNPGPILALIIERILAPK